MHRRRGDFRRSWKVFEKRPNRLRAVDVAVLRAEKRIDNPRKARVGDAAGHAVAAAVDAVEHDVAARRAARGDFRHRRLVGAVAILEIGGGAIPRLAAVGAAPERQRLLRRPKILDGKTARAAATNSIREALAVYAKGDTVPLPASIWIVTARVS